MLPASHSCETITIAKLFVFLLICAEECFGCRVENKIEYSKSYYHRSNRIANATIICSNVTSVSQISYNYVTRNYEQFLTIENSDIRTLPPLSLSRFTTVTKLRLSRLHIETIQPGAFNGLTDLRELHLDNNELSELSNGVFNSLHKLTVLNLTNNRIHQMEEFSLMGVANLTELYLKNNNLSKLEDDVFGTQKLLTHLDLSGNPLDETSLDSLKNLPSLMMLHLSSSGLSSVNFSYFPKFSRLDFAHNQIDEISGVIYGVSELYLGHNRLTVLEETLFVKSRSILTIDVSFNRISTIDRDVFRGLKSMNRLLLQHNNITTIDQSLFRDLTGLTFLNLSHNRIEEFRSGTFDSLEKLAVLDVSSNRLVDLYQHTFNSLRNLTDLYFDDNRISSLDVEDLKSHLRRLNFVSLNGNLWDCKDLVKVSQAFHAAGVTTADGGAYDVENFHGIACSNRKIDRPSESAGFDFQNFARSFRKAIDDGVRDSKLERFFGGGFKDSKFFRYFDDDYARSNFFKYLANYQFAIGNDSKAEKLTSLQVPLNDHNYRVLVVSVVIQVVMSCCLLFMIYVMFSFLKNFRRDHKPQLSSQMELC